MGRRNDDKLTAGQEEAADRAMQALLQRHDQPTVVAPPPELALRIAQRLPAMAPADAFRAERGRTVRRQVAAWGSLLLLMLVSALGAWGVLVDSNAPALFLGGPETTLGYAALVVTLAAKPLIAMVLSLDAIVLFLGILVLLAAGWLWWALFTRPTVLHPTESHL